MGVIELFPARIISTHDKDFEYQQDLIDWIEDYQSKDNSNIVISNVNGYQSQGNFYRYEESFSKFSEKIWKHIENSLDVYTKDIELGYLLTQGHRIYMSNMWINVNPPGAFNHVHVHPGSLLSGVLWIKTPKDCGDLIFRDPMEMNNYCLGENARRFQASAGFMMLFPAHIPHNVDINRSNDTRISISFNLDLSK